MSPTASPFPFLELLACLKGVKRSGWVRRGVPSPTESVADHMYLVSVMCRMVPGFDRQDQERAVMMGLVHDMGEALIGDITPHDGVKKEDKRTKEEMAVKFLACTIRPANPDFADLVWELWSEYEAGETRLAQLVKSLDKLEAMRQALTYEQRSGVDLSEFMALREKVTAPELKPWMDALLVDYESLKQRRSSDMLVIFVSGGPGVGKGTQCQKAAEEFGFCHISVGDLLRDEAKSPTSPYKDFIPESIKKSVLLPAQLTTQLLKEKMGKAQAEGVHKFFLDGFPRSVDQALDFELKISEHNSTISFDCSEDEMRARLEKRAASSGRIDDNPDSVLKRLRTFNENNTPVLEHLQKREPVYHVDCTGSIDEVYASMRNAIRQIVQKRGVSKDA